MPNPYEERIDLPSGQSLWYIDKHPSDPKQNHSYWRHNPKTGRKSKRLAGVTTAVKTLDYDPKNLLKWAAKTQCIGIAELYSMREDAESLHWLSTPESIWAELESHALTFENVRKRAAKRGSNVHEVAFQALGMGRPVPDLERLTPEERGHAHAVMAFWLDHDPEPEQVEQIVYSERLGIAGRLDFRGRLKGYDGMVVVDAKTGKFISASAHVQVGGGYPLLAEESGFGSTDEALILKTSEDGTYELIAAQGSPEDFESAVATYRIATRINTAAKAAREAASTKRRTDAQIEQLMAGAA